eukprot:CAMPEP_0180198636 /NCGR_PEP_ID=MMETSP0987-20121128/5286_1 /TAXON_ID=697907 /ORGANISM="non described non described, Strain CCMP2293" /LENGTH=945 /DNA_ID=CAMNT_0022153677 /DNA_START=48 /DNA_END=2883 /DNA_ORIENTATION=-
MEISLNLTSCHGPRQPASLTTPPPPPDSAGLQFALDDDDLEESTVGHLGQPRMQQGEDAVRAPSAAVSVGPSNASPPRKANAAIASLLSKLTSEDGPLTTSGILDQSEEARKAMTDYDLGGGGEVVFMQRKRRTDTFQSAALNSAAQARAARSQPGQENGFMQVVARMRDTLTTRGSNVAVEASGGGTAAPEQSRAKEGPEVILHIGPVADANNTQEATPFCIIHPHSPVRVTWDVMSLSLLIWSLVIVPLKIAFDFEAANGCNQNFNEQVWHWYVDFVVDVAFMIDFVMNLRTAYYDRDVKNMLVTGQWKIFVNYAKGFLLFDLVASIPIDLIMLHACDDNAGSTTSIEANTILRAPGMLKKLRLVRVVRLLRMNRIKRLFDGFKDTFHINPGVLRLVLFTFIVLLCAHYHACFFFLIGEVNSEDEIRTPTWTTTETGFVVFGVPLGTSVSDLALEDQGPDISSQYWICLYWSITTLTTVGYGDITPVTLGEIAYATFVIIQGGFMLGYVVGSFADLYARIDMRKKRHLEKAEYWEDVFHRAEFAVPLRKRIRDYHEYLLMNRVSKLPDFAQQALSKNLLRDITGHIYTETISSMPMFKGMPAAALTDMALALEHVQVPAGEILYEEGMPGDRMYFLRKGTVQMSILLLTEKQKRELGPTAIHKAIETGVVNRIHAGKFGVGIDGEQHSAYAWNVSQHTCSYFGESVLFAESDEHLSCAVALTPCTMFVLTRKALIKVSDKFPGVAQVRKRMMVARKKTLRPIVQKIIQAHRAKMWRSFTQVKVTVHSALNMPKLDAFTGRCDAYAQVDAGEPEDGQQAISHRTLVCYNTYSPQWNEAFFFPIKEVPEDGKELNINLRVYDWDLVGDHDLVGFATLDIGDLARAAAEESKEMTKQNTWLPIMTERKGKKQVKGYAGRSQIRVSVRINPPHKRPGRYTSVEGAAG